MRITSLEDIEASYEKTEALILKKLLWLEELDRRKKKMVDKIIKENWPYEEKEMPRVSDKDIKLAHDNTHKSWNK